MDIPGSSLLFEWQKKIIQDILYGSNKYGVLEKSRRVGGTFVFAMASVLYCLKTNHNCWFTSTDEKNGKEFIRYVTAFCEVVNSLVGTAYIDLKHATTMEVTLPNGSRITTLSSNPTTLRGKDGLILVDEYAHHENATELYTSVQPSVAQKGKLWMLSTHNGPATPFYNFVSEAKRGKKNWSHFCVTIVDAIKQGFVQRFAPTQTDDEFLQGIKDSCISHEAFMQEFMAEPLSLTALISDIVYSNLVLSENGGVIPETLDPSKKFNELFAGIDVGVTQDVSVLWVLERYANPKPKSEWDAYDYKTVCIKLLRATPIPLQAQILRPLIAHPNMKRVLIDQGAQGHTLAADFKSGFPHLVEPFSFNNPNKAIIAERVKGFMEHSKVSMPRDENIKNQILCIRRHASKTGGTIRYDGHTADSHGDAFWGLGLALEAANRDDGLKIMGMS